MKALEKDIKSEASFIIHENEKHTISQGIHSRTKERILEHVQNGTDVILVTSAKHSAEPILLERYFSDSDDDIRTICLSNSSFNSSSGEQPIDLSMISAVVYESIHLDTHFAIIIDNADEFPIQSLNDLVQLALGINSSKNNVNFIFSGSPNLLSIIEQVSDIRRLSLVHCSLDEITEDDIQQFINVKQSKLKGSPKLIFNKYALKKICSLANGSLQNASIILEWIRLYSLHTAKSKITVGLINDLENTVEDPSLLSSYPAKEFRFADEIKSDQQTNEDNIEFVTHEEALGVPRNQESESRTIYIEVSEDKNSKNNTSSNVYEKVMVNTSHEHYDQDDIHDTAETNPSTTEEIKALDTDKELSESEYTDTYHLEALKHINDPLPYADEDLPITSTTTPPSANTPAQTINNKHGKMSFALMTILVLVIFSGYFAWENQLVDQSYLKSLLPGSFSSSAQSRDTAAYETTISSQIEKPIETSNTPEETLESNDTINGLVTLAHQQIEDKKLTTPPEDNAYETFKLILEFEPKNRDAIAGIEKIKNRYQTWAKLDISEGKIKRAKYFLSLASEISPEDKEIKRLLSSLE